MMDLSLPPGEYLHYLLPRRHRTGVRALIMPAGLALALARTREPAVRPLFPVRSAPANIFVDLGRDLACMAPLQVTTA